MGWPTPQEYNEAIQNPSTCFSDEQLRQTAPELNALGLPKANSGAFASVYKMSAGKQNWAVRCFLRDVANQTERYRRISDFILNDELPYTVDFAYIERGINVRNEWFPILKMDWVEGDTLDLFVRNHINDGKRLEQLLGRFRTMRAELQRFGMAHGDLQHGNILVTPEMDLRLVDYDGVFVPELEGERSNELGHPNYQHPERDGSHFNSSMDDFSAWVIEASLKALSSDSSLLKKLNACDDALLFRRHDFLNPAESPAFYILERHTDERVHKPTRWLRVMATRSIEAVVSPPDELESTPELLPEIKAPQAISMRGDSVDWDQLKDFYNLPTLPREFVSDKRLPAFDPVKRNLQLLREKLDMQKSARYGVQYLAGQMNTYHSATHWVCFVAFGVLIYTVVPLGLLPYFLAAILYVFRGIELDSLYQKAGLIVAQNDPIDVVIKFQNMPDGFFLTVMKAPARYQHLRNKRWKLGKNKDEFMGRYGENCSMRAFVWFQETGRPLAILEGDRIFWLI